ncbi:MAG: FtsX-like permease family protein [Lachnospiraceae bacterium]|nr:FtsX-like permease family protein [Lachnospiraceae bacterium]
MKIVLKHILKNILEKKLRSILIIISLIVATTVFVLNLTLPDEIVLKMQETMRSIFGNADVSITTVENFSLDDLNMGDEEIIAVGITGINGYISDKQVMILGTDIDTAKEIKMLGNDVNTLNKNEIVMTDKQAKKHGYNLNDTIEFTYEDKTYSFKLVKLIKSKGFMSLDREFPVFLANIDVINEIKEAKTSNYSELYIDVKNDKNINDFTDYIKKNNENYIVEMLNDTESIEEALSYISYIMLMIFALASIMIFFVVSSLTKIIIAERMPVIGTFRSIGATKYKMNAILILENTIYGLIGGIIGSICGYIINSNAASLFITTSGVELSNKTSEMSPITIFLGILFSIVLEFFISFRAILKANKKPIKDIIFNIQSTRYIIRNRRIIIGTLLLTMAFIIGLLNSDSNLLTTFIQIIALIVGIANLVPLIVRGMALAFSFICKKIGFASGVIAGKNISYNKMIISSTRLITISLALMISILTISNSFAKSFEAFKYIWDADVMVMNVSKPAKEYEKLTELEGVKKIEFLYYYMYGSITYNDGKEFKGSSPCIVGLDKPIDGIKEINYNIGTLKDDEILIDEIYAQKNNIKLNDILKMKFDVLNKEVTYKVVGFVNSVYFSTTRSILVVNLSSYLDNFTDIPVWVQVVANDSTDLQKLKTTIKDEIKEVAVQIMTFDEYVDEQEASTTSVMSLFYIIIGLAVILSFVGIVNNQIIGFIQRKKELAVLNSTCMSKGQLKRMLILEVLVANAISCVIAILTGYFATGMLDSFLEGMSMYIAISYDWLFVLKFVGLIYVILMLTLVIPSRKINKMNIVNEIKYE